MNELLRTEASAAEMVNETVCVAEPPRNVLTGGEIDGEVFGDVTDDLDRDAGQRDVGQIAKGDGTGGGLALDDTDGAAGRFGFHADEGEGILDGRRRFRRGGRRRSCIGRLRCGRGVHVVSKVPLSSQIAEMTRS